MILEIVMPHYNEPWSIVRPYFDMLRCQRGVDFSQFTVHIVHDGTQEFPQSYFYDMPFNVRQSVIKHSGVSAARNYGLDHADAKWITFCDCDDTFSNVYALKIVFDVLDTEDYDLLWNAFIIENNVGGKLFLHPNEKFNMIWTHNKYYRLDFLKRIGLHFNENLHFSEDSAFNAVVNCEIDQDRIGTIKSPFPMYVWSWRAGSATINPQNRMRNIEGHFDRNCYVLEEFRKRDLPDTIPMVGRTLTDAYFQTTRKDIVEDTGPLMKRIAEFYKKEKQNFEKISKEDFVKVYHASEKEVTDSGLINPNRPIFDDWLEELMERGEET